VYELTPRDHPAPSELPARFGVSDEAQNDFDVECERPERGSREYLAISSNRVGRGIGSMQAIYSLADSLKGK
jgi:hypothetical protein